MFTAFRAYCVVFLVALGASVSVAAELRLNRYYSNDMVLQRGKPVVLRGSAGAGATVTVTFAGQTKSARATTDGTWAVTLDAMAGSAEGRELGVKAGTEALTLRNVVVGDVLLYARQTSADVALGSTAAGLKALRSYKPSPNFRAIQIKTLAAKQPLNDLDAQATDGWSQVPPLTADKMSAAAFYLGRDLAKDHEVPIGIIDLNMGVYFAIGWLSDEALNASIQMLPHEKELRGIIDDMRQAADARDSGEAQRELDEYYADLVATAKGKPIRPKPSLGLHPIRSPMYPCGGYNAVLHPLRGVALKGVVLQLGADYAHIPYRRLAVMGEAQNNAELDEAWAQTYMIMKLGYRSTDKTLPHVPADWRKAFGDESLPIGLVNPPSSDLDAYAKHHREMREQHRRMALANPRVGLILPGMDNVPFTGQPADEQLLAERCRHWVLGEVLARPGVVATGPQFDRIEAHLADATVYFKPGTAEGLTATGKALEAFEVSSPDGQFMPAAAKIDGATLKLHCADVGQIQFVRFNWQNRPDTGLVNRAGLPALPFNSDDRWTFGWITEEKEEELPEEYSTTADTWGDSDVAIINGEVDYLEAGDSQPIPRRPGPLGIYSSPFGPNIYVISIDPGTPAVGKLMPGDYIFGVNGEKFQGAGDTPYLQLANAITHSESEAGGGKLTCMVRRGKKIMNVTLQLQVLGTYSSTSPYYCQKTENLIERAKQWSTDRFRPQAGPASSPAGMLNSDALFLLATGDPEVQGLVRRIVYGKMADMDPLTLPTPESRTTSNWGLGYDMLLLGEYYHATGDRNVLPYLKNRMDWAVWTQIKPVGAVPKPWEEAHIDEAVGGWRHKGPTAADRWKSGYGLMPHAGMTCVMGMLYAKEAGLDVDSVALERGIRHFRHKRAEHAFVLYSYANVRRDAPPTLDPDAEAAGKLSSMNGKLGTAAALFSLLDDHRVSQICARQCVYAFNNTRGGHGGMFFNNLWTPIGAAVSGKDGLQHFMQGQTWWRELFRRSDGSFDQAGRGGVGVGYAIHYVAPRQRLRIFGAPRTAFGTAATDYLQPALEAHRARDYARCEQLLVKLPNEMPIPAAHQPMVDHFLQSVRTLRASLEHDLNYTEQQIAKGNYDYAHAEVQQLRGVVAENHPRLVAILKALELPQARAAMKALSAQRNQEAAAQKAALQEALPPKRHEKWVTLTPDGHGDGSTEWRMKLIEARSQAPDGWVEPDFDDVKWDKAHLPMSWAMYHSVLFRGTFNVKDKSQFDAVRLRGELFRQGNVLVYINGKLVAKVDQIGRGAGLMDAKLTDYALELLKDGENTVAFTTRHQRRWGALRGKYVQAARFTFMLDARMKP